MERRDADARAQDLALQLGEQRADLARAARGLPLTIAQQGARIRALEAALLRAEATFKERLVQVGLSANTDSTRARYVPGTNTQLDLAFADVRAARAELEAAQIQVELSRADSLELIKRRLQVARMQTELVRARRDIERFTLEAPGAGVVLTEQLERRVGSYIQAGESICDVADTQKWRVVLLVGERDVHDVRPGQEATVEIPGLKLLDGRFLTGSVESVAPQPVSASMMSADAATSMPGAGAFRVIVRLGQRDVESLGPDALRRGYAVQGRIIKRAGSIASIALTAAREWVNEHRWK